MSDAPLGDLRLDVTVVRGGHPDAATLGAIEQAVRSVLAAPASDPAGGMPAWRRAARLEAVGARRVCTLAGLAERART